MALGPRRLRSLFFELTLPPQTVQAVYSLPDVLRHVIISIRIRLSSPQLLESLSGSTQSLIATLLIGTLTLPSRIIAFRAVPSKAQQYHYTKVGSYAYLVKRDVDVPKPKEGEVLVKIHAVSLQLRDLGIASSKHRDSQNLVPCSDMAGEIVRLGPKSTHNAGFRIGDRVCANFVMDHVFGGITLDDQKTTLGGQKDGVLTQYKVFPVHCLVKFPNHLSHEEASTLPCTTLTAYNALNGPVPVKAGDTVLVLGTGGVSIAALQLATASGANVIITSSSDDKLKFAMGLGAKCTINYRKQENWCEEVLKFTNGIGVDHVIEVGGYGTLLQSIHSVRPGGWIHIVGSLTGAQPPIDIIRYAIQKSITFRGVYVGSVDQFKSLNRLISSNPTTTRPVIDKIFKWDEAKTAFRYLDERQKKSIGVGKVVIRVVGN